MGQSYDGVEDCWTGLVRLGPRPEGLYDGVWPGTLNDDACMSQNTNQVQNLAPTWQ